MKRRTKRYLIFGGILTFVLIWILILNFLPPDSIVAKVGTKNSYIILFLISAIGGVSSISASSYYLAISVFASGGLSPIVLGIVGGIGVTIGDSLFFYLGKKGKDVSTKDLNKRTEKLNNWINKSPKGAMPIIIFTYVGLTPMPNDLLTAPLGFLGYPYKKIIAPLILGNITGTIIVAYLSIYGFGLLV